MSGLAIWQLFRHGNIGTKNSVKCLVVIVINVFSSIAYAQTDAEIADSLIKESISGYHGQCACPYSINRYGKPCGEYNAYSKPGGVEPLCYRKDVTAAMINDYKKRYGVKEPIVIEQQQPIIVQKPVIIKQEAKKAIVVTEVTVVGYGETKDIALMDAFFNAVQNAVGVQVSTETVLINGELLRDKISTTSTGLIQKYDVIEPYNNGKIKVTTYVDVDNVKKILSKK